MIDMTYDPEADAAYVTLGRRQDRRKGASRPVIYDVDADGRVIGIEILSASKVLRRRGGR